MFSDHFYYLWKFGIIQNNPRSGEYYSYGQKTQDKDGYIGLIRIFQSFSTDLAQSKINNITTLQQCQDPYVSRLI